MSPEQHRNDDWAGLRSDLVSQTTLKERPSCSSHAMATETTWEMTDITAWSDHLPRLSRLPLLAQVRQVGSPRGPLRVECPVSNGAEHVRLDVLVQQKTVEERSNLALLVWRERAMVVRAILAEALMILDAQGLILRRRQLLLRTCSAVPSLA